MASNEPLSLADRLSMAIDLAEAIYRDMHTDPAVSASPEDVGMPRLLSAIFLALYLSALLAAPAPRPRPPRPPAPLARAGLVGVWRANLGRDDLGKPCPFVIALHRDGVYQRTDDAGDLREGGYWDLRADGALLIFRDGVEEPEVWAHRGGRRWHCEPWFMNLHLVEKMR